MNTCLQDLRYAVRTIRRAPAFTFIVVLTLGLGISGLVARFPTNATLTVRGQAERVNVELISGNTFEVLGASTVLGRPLTPDDDRRPGGHPVAVISHSYWQRRFAGSPSVLNQVVTVNRTPVTIVGVSEWAFAGVASAQMPDLFMPMMMKAELTPTWNDLDNRRSRWVNIVGRLKPGVTIEAAKSRLDVVYQQINEYELNEVPAFAGAPQTFKDRYRAKKLTLYPAARGLSEVRGSFSAPLYVLMAMVGLVLLIACANVANLLLTRATARQREMAMRLALGAARERLIRQVLTESMVLAIAGGVVGLVLSIWLGDVLLSVLPSEVMTRSLSTAPDLRIGLFTAGLSLLTAVVFGLAPALQASRPELNRTLREEAGSVSGGQRQARFRKGLVVAQVALSMLLVAGAGLFARSLYNLKQLNPGFETDNLISFRVDPSLNGYDQSRIKRFYDSLLQDLRSTPGVLSASAARESLLTQSVAARTIEVQGYTTKPEEDMNPWWNEVAPDYVRTFGTPLLMGREFNERDTAGAPLVAIVNETFAKYYFGNQNPVGRRFGWRSLKNPGAIEIVGVVKDTLYAAMREGENEANKTPRYVYTPYQQSEELGAMTLYVRAAAHSSSAMPELLRQAVRRADASMPVFELQTMEKTVDDALFNERMLALLSASFGLLATVLAAIALYGVMSYTVSRRTREIGIRIALGAERATVLWLVLREVAFLTFIGIAVGVPGALGLSRFVKSQLFGIEPTDPLTLLVAAATLTLVALLAGYLPARRAARVQPVFALRYE